jgi:hypothetical protein
VSKARTNLTVKTRKWSIVPLLDLLQKGFVVEGLVGVSILAFLTGELGLESQYVAERISTVFLDGKVVDDLETAVIAEGSLIAFSGALPGLVGATMRRKGVCAPMRSSITYEAKGCFTPAAPGTFRVKLFNVVLKDLAPLFLERGIVVDPVEADLLVRAAPAYFWTNAKEVLLNGTPMPYQEILSLDWTCQPGPVLLKVFAYEPGR